VRSLHSGMSLGFRCQDDEEDGAQLALWDEFRVWVVEFGV
jgi:hypothetical protein